MQIKEALKQKNLRITPARISVLTILDQSVEPLDIASILKLVKSQKIQADPATIYRIIENFLEKGLASKIQLNEKKFYYEGVKKEHHHAVCEKCGKIEDVMKCSINKSIKDVEKNKGFTVRRHSLELFGLCASCV